MRDDFPRKVVEELEKRAGHVCSYPQCRMVTRGAVYGNGGDAKENVGQASHITAASPGGPRYDATMTSDERKGIDNAIWIVEHEMLESLYNRCGDKVIGILLALPVHIQLMACTTDEKVLNAMLSGHKEEFACDQIGKVAVWRSKKDYLKFG